MRSVAFIQKMFCDYYMRDYSLESLIPMMERREFGFFSFEGRMLRHKSFRRIDELKEFLEHTVPSDAYCSCAYYEDPEANMDQKGWLGADLIFDIDADHIPSPCDKVHDKWVCCICDLNGKGSTPVVCPVCRGQKFDVSTWPCEVCLASAKEETTKLLDMLMQDFGFSEREMRVFFSGHRGFHVHVESKAVETLGTMSRKEIVDYVSGLGLDVSFHGLAEKSLRVSPSRKGSPLSDFGWGKRLTNGMQDFILNAEEQNFEEAGLSKGIIKIILSNRKEIREKLLDRGTLGAIKGIGVKSWKKIAAHTTRLQSAKIDTVVTTDIHRLIRLERTLHSKTGFIKTEFSISDMDDFDPFTDAVAFKNGSTTISVLSGPEFRIGDRVFGPYEKQRVELPTAAAMLLVCKQRAEVVQFDV